jgi:hypothetical protein
MVRSHTSLGINDFLFNSRVFMQDDAKAQVCQQADRVGVLEPRYRFLASRGEENGASNNNKSHNQ